MRSVVVLRYSLPLILSFARDRRRWLVLGTGVRRTAAFHDRRADRLLRAFTRLGPSFIKLGQIFAGRADVLGEPYADRLSTLTDQVPPAPLDEVRRRIESSLGRPIDQTFEAFEPEPIAAGSLGQVYRARYQGRAVAVKVLRPGVRELVAADLAVARRVLRWVVRWFPNPHTRAMSAVVEEFAVRVKDEMDFRVEAANAIAVKRNIGRNPRFRLPEVVSELTTDQVLVLEYLEGTRIDRLERDRAYGGLRIPDVVERLTELYIQMMLVDGLFHADPHPGNLLVTPDGRLVLLDFGVVIVVTRERRKALVETVFAAVKSDAPGVVQGLYNLGLVEPGADPAVIRRLVDLLLDLAARRTTTEERVELLSHEILDELHDWPVRLPSDLVYFARTAALIEGIGIKYDPYYNPIRASGPALFRMRGKLMASLAEAGVLDQIDWPTALGTLVGRAAGLAARAGQRFAEFLDRTMASGSGSGAGGEGGGGGGGGGGGQGGPT
jgi:predicted unusual protein kinase regulating ubiquinone biosynthesis (AarF/ABC1/UbiB family)